MEITNHRWTRRTWGIVAAGLTAGLIAAGTLAIVNNDDGSASPSSTTAADQSVTSATSIVTAPESPTTNIVNRTITVSGEGRITVKPDTATIYMGVTANADKATDALNTANQKMEALIDSITKAGVPKEKITTSSINIGSNYDRDGKPSGFTASNQLVVEVEGVDKAGPVVDAAAAAAGENITLNGINFSVGDPETVLAEARKAAIDNARKRAGEFASAAGVNVGAVIQISEVGVNVPQPMYEAAAADAGGSRAMSTPIMAGDQSMSVNVTVVFELV